MVKLQIVLQINVPKAVLLNMGTWAVYGQPTPLEIVY